MSDATEKLPAEFSHLISQQDYSLIIQIIRDYFMREGKQLICTDSGCLRVIEDSGNMICEYSLSNLIRYLSEVKKNEWKENIHYFFRNSDISLSAYNFYLDDYAHARKHLKVLIKPADFNPKGMEGKLVRKTHFPGTVSALVFHFKRQFRFLSSDDVKNWNISEDELLEEGVSNVAKEEMSVEGREVQKGVQLYCIISSQYSAAAMIRMDRKFPCLAGEAGTVFSLPSNGTVFAMPLNRHEDLKPMLRPLLNITTLAFQREPSPITFDLFHCYQGEVSSMLQTLKSFGPGIYHNARFKN